MTPGNGAPLVRGGQQSVQSWALRSGLQDWPCQSVVHLVASSQLAMGYVQRAGGRHVVVSGPSMVRGEGIGPGVPIFAVGFFYFFIFLFFFAVAVGSRTR